MIFDFKNGFKMNLTIITKNYAADPEIATAMPTAWELS